MKFVARLEQLASFIGSLILFLIMTVTFADVVGRTFFSSPLLGAVELTELLMAAMVFLLLPSVTLRQEHISVDLIDPMAGKVLDVIRNVLTGVLGVAFFGMMAWRLVRNAGRSASYGDATINLGIPIAPFLYGMAALAALTALVFLFLLFRMRTRSETAEMEAARRLAEQSE